MKKPRYEAPRALKLSDAKTSTMHCANGRMGNRELCYTGLAVTPHNICANGTQVLP